jgi:hypothetical protein
VLVAEEKLAVEVAEVDGVEVDDVDLAEAGEDEVLEQLASDSSGAYHQDARLHPRTLATCVFAQSWIELTCAMSLYSKPRLWTADLSRPIALSCPLEERFSCGRYDAGSWKARLSVLSFSSDQDVRGEGTSRDPGRFGEPHGLARQRPRDRASLTPRTLSELEFLAFILTRHMTRPQHVRR